MGRQSGQMSMMILDMGKLISENHVLQKNNQMVLFDFVYGILPHRSILQMVVHPLLLSVCIRCCRWDTFTGSRQNSG